MPKSLLVVGSGAIGIEFASFYNAMGVDVTVVEIMDQVMPVEDAEIARIAHVAANTETIRLGSGGIMLPKPQTPNPKLILNKNYKNIKSKFINPCQDITTPFKDLILENTQDH